MGSRLKQNPEQTFQWFFEATCPVTRDKDPGIQFQFPEDFSNEESCQTVPRFCFPYDIQRARDGVAVQHFTFVLTDLEGSQKFGFCRLTNSTHTCLCILSYLPWFEVFYKLLNNLADYLMKGQTNEMKALLATLYKQSVPLTAGSVTLQMGEPLLVSTEVSHRVGHPEGQEGVPYFIAPDPRSLPCIPENRNLTELIVAVDVGNLLQLYASMLFERRILLFASKLSTLTSCVHALSAVIYPMYWQHIFIPVLPPHLLDYCCAPMPYLIGVHTSLSEKVRSRGMEEVVILNVDSNTLETPFDDLKRIPSDVMAGLKICLKRQAISPGCGVSRAFLKAQALLFGGYGDALQGDREGGMWFSEELFLDHKSASMRQFQKSAVHLQFFKQFIDNRLDLLNKGKDPDDLFEEEILNCDTTARRSKSYQQLVGSLKKGGGALILNMKSKANIKSKGLAKSGLKNLLMHKTHGEAHFLQRAGSVSHRRAQSDSLQNRLPITQHFGKSRPRRPVHKRRGTGDEVDAKDNDDSWNGDESGAVVEPESELQKDEEEEEDSLLCEPEEMDLLGEIFDTLSSRSSHERGLLYSTRSLDLFGPDSHDYILKHGFPANPSQESLSISGSGSLHSWNLETTEELSDLTEDSDWLCQDTSVPEEEEAESQSAAGEFQEEKSGPEEDREKWGRVEAAINGNREEEIDDRNNCKEVEDEEEGKGDGQAKRMSLGEDAEKPEEEKLNEEMEDEEEVIEQETAKRTSEMLKDLKGEQEEEKGEENQKDEELTDSLHGVAKINLNHHNSGEEHRGQEDNLKPSSPSLGDSKPLAAQDNRHEEAGEEQERRQTFSPPRVLSAASHFQSQAHGQGSQPADSGTAYGMFQGRQKAHTQPSPDTNTSKGNRRSEGHEEEEPPMIKVSELKKRFEF